MLTVNTKAYGRIDVDERQRIHFPYGIFGFEQLKDFVLLDAAQQPFYWLQSMDVKETAFVLINPLVFRKDYELNVLVGDLEEIGLKSTPDDNILLFAIVTVPQNQQKMSANLQGPIIINRDNKQGRQSVSLDPRWKTKHYILEELSGKSKEEAC
ncbi:MAG: flagellar assembly protein FliW [Spirochaetales bacterium]|uniref:Flagellar assembly factor FliW n=1 Tax=Candidatus Thalassospirochaeta sargassi TaxID=3119039 RepID=A0AAJ1IIW3_9SPIO|nr:flagellar assembly protein FliW [Spirochaetales bacterium]